MALCLESGRRCCATGPLRERLRVTRVRLGSLDCCSNLLPLNWVWQQVCAQIKPLVWLGTALCRTNLRLRSNRLAFGPWPLSQRRAHCGKVEDTAKRLSQEQCPEMVSPTGSLESNVFNWLSETRFVSEKGNLPGRAALAPREPTEILVV